PATASSLTNDAFNALGPTGPNTLATDIGVPDIGAPPGSLAHSLGLGPNDVGINTNAPATAPTAGPGLLGGASTPDATPVSTISVTGAPPSISAPTVGTPVDTFSAPPASTTFIGGEPPSAPPSAPTETPSIGPSTAPTTAPTEGPTTPGISPGDLGPGPTGPTDPGTIASLGGGGVPGDVLSPHSVLSPGGSLGSILGPGAGVAGQQGGILESTGQVIPELLSGQAMSSEQIVAFTNAQTALLTSWSQVISPDDARWPQVVALVNQQAL